MNPHHDRAFFPHDGRNLDPERADLSGEAAELRVAADLNGGAEVPTIAGAAVVAGTRGMLKSPRWEWQVPAYLALGGIGGASAVLAATVAFADGDDARRFVDAARLVSASSTAAGGVLLIADLGRPERFLNMMRVFRPTSPMNLGVWVLAAHQGVTWMGVGSALLPGDRWRSLGHAATLAGGLLGLPLCGYTGVLFGSTANPAWHELRRELPPLFVASAASAAGGVLTLIPAAPRHRRAAELFGIGGRIGDLLMTRRARRRLAPFPTTSAAWHEGRSGRLERAANTGTLAALVLGVLGIWSRSARRTGAIAAIASSFALRFAVLEAGQQAASDPDTVRETQRADPEPRGNLNERTRR